MNAYGLNVKEQQVFAYITISPKPVTLTEIAATVFPELSPVKANSWVRNNIRRLRDVLGLIRKVDRGTYAPLAVAPVAIEAPSVKPSPMQLTLDQVEQLTVYDIEKVKNLDCVMYNDCLTLARDGDWAGFGCHSCSAYVEPEPHQKVSDMLALIALDTASENEEENGCAGRKRGVRPGADAKVKPRKLYVIQGEAQQAAVKNVA